jgi:predicted N-acetyltransferase YhbS
MNTIRNLTEQDIPECGQVFLEVFGPNGCGERWTLETSLKNIADNTGDKNYCFVAIADEKIVGMILAFPVAREANTDIFIDTICVLSSYQGQHLGKSLLNAVKEVAKENNAQFVRLLGNPKFLSFDWYKKIGMVPSGWVELEKKI